jgi:hypothetical protein
MGALRRAAIDAVDVLRASTPTHAHLRDRLFAVAIFSVGLNLAVAVVALLLERHAKGTQITNYGDAVFWTSTQLLTVSSSTMNPLTTGGRILDVLMEAYAITVVATVAGAFGAFFHRRGRERDEAKARHAAQPSDD